LIQARLSIPLQPEGRGHPPRARVDVVSLSLGGRAISAALDPEIPPAKAAALSLAIIREVDPPVQASVEVSADLTPEDVRSMSYSELIATARAIGVEIPGSLPEASEEAKEPPHPFQAT
jgi:hypothetical protein